MSMSLSEYRRLKPRKKPLKYKNQPLVVNGQRYRSIKEYTYHTGCMTRMKAKDPAQRVVKIEREVYFLLVPAQRDANSILIERAMGYFLDFRVTYADGHVEHVDTKSPVTRKNPFFIAKRKLMLERHGIRITEV